MLSLVPSILVLLLASPANSQLAPEASAAATNGHSPVAVSDHADIAKEPDKAPPGEDEEALRRELAAARAELARQAQVLKEQRQTDEALTLNLETAQRVIENFRAEASLWDSEKGAMAEAHPASKASQAAATRALDDERHKAELLEQELTTARQTIDALKTGVNLAAQERAKAVKARQVADAASNQAGLALKLERERADAAIRDLESARKERDALRQGSMELNAALEQERERANGLARSLSAAREEIDVARDRRRSAAVERAPKARTATSALASSSSRSGAARNPGLPKKQKVKGPKPPQTVVLATIALPVALLPTRPPAK